MVECIKPLDEDDIRALKEMPNDRAGLLRLLANGRAVDVFDGCLMPKHTNVIYHPVVWDISRDMVRFIVDALKEKNEGVVFKIDYQRYDGDA